MGTGAKKAADGIPQHEKKISKHEAARINNLAYKDINYVEKDYSSSQWKHFNELVMDYKLYPDGKEMEVPGVIKKYKIAKNDHQFDQLRQPNLPFMCYKKERFE